MREDDLESLRRAQRWPELADTLARRVSLATDAGERKALLLQLADVQRNGCNQRVAAIQALEAALELAPGDPAIVESLASAYEERKQWQRLVELRTSQLAHADPAGRLAGLIDIARITAAHVPRDAIEAWRRVLAIDPVHPEAMEVLQSLYQRHQQWDALAELCGRQVDVAATPAERAAILRKLVQLYILRIPDPERAIAAAGRVLELEPDDEATLRTLRKLYGDRKAWRELEETYTRTGKVSAAVRAFEQRAPHEDAEHQFALWCRVGELYRDELRDRPRAVASFERAFVLRPTDTSVAVALAALHDPETHAAAFVAAAAVARQAAADPEAWLAQTRRLAELCDRKLQQLDAALGYQLEVFAVDWRSEATRTELARLAGVAGAWERVVAAYAAVCEQTIEPPGEQVLVPLLVEIARIHELELGQRDLALETNRRIVDRYGLQRQALDALERLYRASERWADVLALHERQLDELTDADTRRVVLMRIGRLCEDQLEDHRRARATYRTILEAGFDRDAMTAFERVCARTEAWAELAEVLSTALPSAPGEARDRLSCRLGELHERAGDATAAIAHYRAALEEHVGNAEARAGLERFLGELAHRAAAAEALAPAYEMTGAYTKLVAALEVLAETESASERRVELLLKAGLVCELHLDDLDQAFGAYTRALVEAPGHHATQARLEDIARATDGWAALAEAYRTTFALPLELSHQIELRWRLGRVYGEELGDLDRAARCFRRVLDLCPSHPAALAGLDRALASAGRGDELAAELASGSPAACVRSPQPTARAVRRLQSSASEQWGKVIDVRLALAARERDPDRRGQHYYEAGIVYRDRLEQPGDALDCFEQAVDAFFHESQLPIVDASVRAVQAIEAIHTAAAAWPALEQSYRLVIALLERRGGAGLLLSMMWEALADLYRHRLGDRSASARALEQALLVRERLATALEASAGDPV